MATSGRKVSPYRRGKENHGGSTASIQMPGFWERHFWLLACGVVLISVIARVFDFSIAPPGYDGLVITEPFCGLHSWDLADRAWAARSHVKYGLGYTKGLRTLVVGNPPPEHPQYDVSEPPLETWILAAGMLLLGTEDWSVRLFEVLLAVPCLFLILLVLRKLYGGACALLTGLLLVLMPLSGYFGFNPLMVLLALWALYEYLLLTGRLGEEPTAQGRHLLGLAVALFVIVQVNWVGVFYAFVIGVHYVVRCLIRQQVRWKVMTALALPSLLSLALSISMMAWGFRNNIAVEAATRPPAEVKIDRGKLMPPLVYKVGPQEKDTAWGMMKTLYQWRSREGELASFSWRAWVGQNLVFAYTNFTAPILLCLAGYLLYLLIAHLYILDRQVINPPGVDSAKKPIKIPYSFTHMWFFLLPALLFLFTFKGLFWKHQYWQAPFALFVALGAAWGLLLLCEAFEGAHRWFGKSIVAALIVVIAIFSNQGLASYRAVRWHSPRTIELFRQLNKQIPPDKGLLTFKDFVIQQNRAKVASYREEYAWYLDREMAVANAWQYEM